MPRNRKRKTKAAPKKSRKASAQRASKQSRAGGAPWSEITGILALGGSIFLFTALLSVQFGTGSLMGPFGRTFAVLVYSLIGVCSYVAALSLGFVAIRLLLSRQPVVRFHIAAGVILGCAAIAVLAHLFGGEYRLAGHAAGGAIGETVGEVLRAVISTAGTALVALLAIFVAVVIATPLRMSDVLSVIGGRGRRVFATVSDVGSRVARGTASFVSEVARALLPERDRDEYLEDYDEDEEEEYDEEEEQDEAEDEQEEAVPDVIDFKESSKMQIADEQIIELGVKDRKKTKKAKAKSNKKGKKTLTGIAVVGDGETSNWDGVVADVADADITEKNSPPTIVVTEDLIEAEAIAADDPVIVESEFRSAGADALAEKEAEVDKERLDFIPLGDGEYKLPPVNLLDYDDNAGSTLDRTAMLELSAKLSQTLENYGVKGRVAAIRPGPVVTMYEFAPAPGTRISKITRLADDLAMSLEALKVRIVAPIPGKAAVGIEVPNRERETVYLKEIVADDTFQKGKAKLPLALGKNIEGAPSVVDLAKMPHLLVAGTTGSGKSVSVNSMITSLLYNCTPEEVRMIMVDPKMLELSIYEGVPHLLLPVVTDPKKANLALRWAVDEMERRYDLLAQMGVRDIASYNKKLEKSRAKYEAAKLQHAADVAALAASDDDGLADDPDQDMPTLGMDEPPRRLPFIVVIIDEFADLIMCAPKEVETSVARIAQKARAAGIHLILATQRPSVNVITGIIKANFPSRIAFRVASKVDSRTILDTGGAEALLGAGDMLFSDRGAAPRRLHGNYVGEEEIHRIVDFLKGQAKPVYNLEILKPRDDDEDGGGEDSDGPADEMYDKAVAIVAETQRVSISYLQRRLSVGYNRAAKMVERMERLGVVSAPDNKKVREVLISDVDAA